VRLGAGGPGEPEEADGESKWSVPCCTNGDKYTYPIGTPKQPIWAHKSLCSGGMLVRPSLRARWWWLA
jgi:hypothetical protein